MFSKPSVKDLLSRFVLVQLYTDVIPPRYQPTTTPEENRAFQNREFGTAQLPLYVILKPLPDGKFEVVGQPYAEGKINDIPGFSRFLEEPLKSNGNLRESVAAKGSG